MTDNLLTLCFAAILAENAVFSRLFGADAIRNTKNCFLVSGIMIPVMAVCAAVGAVLYNSLLLPMGLGHLHTVAFVAVTALVAKCAELVYNALFKKNTTFMPIVTLNCTLLGVMLTNAQSGAAVLDSVIYGVLAAIGFALALILYNGVEQRLKLACPSPAFEGAPLTLIAAGLVAMVFMGFTGIDFGGGFTPFKLS